MCFIFVYGDVQNGSHIRPNDIAPIKMFYETEYPRVYSASKTTLDILTKPITWFKPFLSGIGQLLLYRLKIKPRERRAADQLLEKKIIHMSDGTELMVGISGRTNNPDAIVIYLHTVCGTYMQMAHIADLFKNDNITYLTYTRSGNDSSLPFATYNFVGRIEELQLIIRYCSINYPGVPIHAIGASAGSALLIRYLGRYNSDKLIRSAVLVSPGYNFMHAFEVMNPMSKAYLVNKIKFTIRKLPGDNLHSIRTLDDWLTFQSKHLGYRSRESYILDCDPVNYLHLINVPTLCLSALDDNIFDGKITEQYLHLPSINPNITIAVTKRGGHVIFEDEGHDMPWFLRVAYEWIHTHIRSPKI